MYETFNLTDVVVLDSQYLDSNIQQHLENEAKKQFIGKCSQTVGYIVEIKDVVIQSSEISMADSTNRFTVTYTAHTILPKAGNIYKSVSLENVINHDCFHGALMNIYNFCKTVSSEQYTDSKKNEICLSCIQVFVTNGIKNKDVFVFPECDCVINCITLPTPCTVDIVVDFSKYKNGQFCITGRHIH